MEKDMKFTVKKTKVIVAVSSEEAKKTWQYALKEDVEDEPVKITVISSVDLSYKVGDGLTLKHTGKQKNLKGD